MNKQKIKGSFLIFAGLVIFLLYAVINYAFMADDMANFISGSIQSFGLMFLPVIMGIVGIILGIQEYRKGNKK